MNRPKICGNLRNLGSVSSELSAAVYTAQQPTATGGNADCDACARPLPEEETIVPNLNEKTCAHLHSGVPAPPLVVRSPTRTGCRWRKQDQLQSAIQFSHHRSIFPTQEPSALRGRRSRSGEKNRPPRQDLRRRHLRHYRNRGILPFEIVQNLDRDEYKG